LNRTLVGKAQQRQTAPNVAYRRSRAIVKGAGLLREEKGAREKEVYLQGKPGTYIKKHVERKNA